MEQRTNASSAPKKSPFETYNWIIVGLFWSTLMFFTLNMVFPVIEGEKMDLSLLAYAIPAWIIVGLGFGYIIKLVKE